MGASCFISKERKMWLWSDEHEQDPKKTTSGRGVWTVPTREGRNYHSGLWEAFVLWHEGEKKKGEFSANKKRLLNCTTWERKGKNKSCWTATKAFV